MPIDDIVAQLRIWSIEAKDQDATDVVVGLSQAADEIERLRAENETLRKQLDQFVGDFKDEVQREAL